MRPGSRPLHSTREGRRHHRIFGGRHQSINHGAQETLPVGEPLRYCQVYPLFVGTDLHWILVCIL